jgi:hypothetical protein
MIPREHGAYGQLAFPLATAFAIAGLTEAGVLMAVAALSGFLAHEPLLVLLGQRGPRVKRERARQAVAWLAVAGGVAVAAGVAALWFSPAAARWSFAIPLVPAALLGLALLVNAEKSTVGELAAVVTFSSLAIPVCLVSDVSLRVAVSIALAFALLFTASTLGVRVVILKVRGGGSPERVRSTRLLLFAVTAAAIVGLVLAAMNATLPWLALFAAIPGVAVATALAVCPPAPTRLRTVGWTLVSASAAAALILIVGFRIP